MKAKIVTEVLPSSAPGSIQYQTRDNSIIGMTFSCPSGSGAIGGCSFEAGGWTWNGNQEAPSLSPSIWLNKPDGWHGYLRDGKWIEC